MNKLAYEMVDPSHDDIEPSITMGADDVDNWQNWAGGRNDAATDNLAWTGLGALAGGVAGHAFKAPVLGAALGGTAGAVGSSIATKRQSLKSMAIANQLRQILEARNRVSLPAGQFKMASIDGPLADLNLLSIEEAAANLQRYQADLQVTKQAEGLADYLPTSLAGQTALGAGVGGVLGAGAGLIGEHGRDAHRRNYLRAALMGSLGGGALGAGAGALYNLGSSEYKDVMKPKPPVSLDVMRNNVTAALGKRDYAAAAKLEKELIAAYGAGTGDVTDHAVPAVTKAIAGGLEPYIPDTSGAPLALPGAGAALGAGVGVLRNRGLRNQVDVSDMSQFNHHVNTQANTAANAAGAGLGPAPTSREQVMAENSERLARAHHDPRSAHPRAMAAMREANTALLHDQARNQAEYETSVNAARQPILDRAAQLQADVQHAQRIPGSTFRRLVDTNGQRIELTPGQRANLPHAAGGIGKQTIRVGKYGLTGMGAGWLGSMLSDTLHTPPAQQQFDAAKAKLQ